MTGPAPRKRKLTSWLKGLLEYVEDTEAPRDYWFWSGIYTISAALQRRVWVDYGIENIYPNLYLCFVARPGEKKGAPVKLSRKMLTEVNIPVSVDSASKRALTKELVKTGETEQFMHPDGKPRKMCSLAIISPEFGSLLAVDKEGMIGALTDLFDAPDTWKYSTSDKGNDFLYNVCLGFFAATTQRYILNNLPPETFGEGFASRVLWLSERPMYKPVYWPAQLNRVLYRALIHDLAEITHLVGEFKVDEEVRTILKLWYDKIPERKKLLRDDRLHGNLNRLHIQVLKTAMCLHVAENSDLIITPNDIGRAIDFVEEVFATTAQAFGGSGQSLMGPMVDSVRNQVAILKETSFKELMQMNWRNMTKSQLEEVLCTLDLMGEISRPIETCGCMDQVIRINRKKKLN